MGSPGNFRDLKDLFVNLTTCWRLEESLRRNRVISFSFVFLCLSASCNQHLAPNSVGGLYSLSCWGHIHAPVCHAFLFCQLNAIRIVVSFLFFSFLSNKSWADNISWLRKKFWKIVVLARGSLWLGWDVWWICEWGEIFLDLLLIGNKSIKAVLSWKITVFCQKCNDWK